MCLPRRAGSPYSGLGTAELGLARRDETRAITRVSLEGALEVRPQPNVLLLVDLEERRDVHPNMFEGVRRLSLGTTKLKRGSQVRIATEGL